MKNLLIIATLLTGGAHAVTIEDCKRGADDVRKIMAARQQGVEMSVVYTRAPSYRHAVIEAYKRPFAFTDEYKQRAIEDLGNEYFLHCVMDLDNDDN